MSDHTPYQRQIIKRYYRNFDRIKFQRLSELVGDLYLAPVAKRPRLWEMAASILQEFEFPQSRIDHLLNRKDPALLTAVLKEIEGKIS